MKNYNHNAEKIFESLGFDEESYKVLMESFMKKTHNFIKAHNEDVSTPGSEYTKIKFALKVSQFTEFIENETQDPKMFRIACAMLAQFFYEDYVDFLNKLQLQSEASEFLDAVSDIFKEDQPDKTDKNEVAGDLKDDNLH